METNQIDPDWVVRTETYSITDLQTGDAGGVISKSAVIRHFHRLNPDIVVKQTGSFKINHQDHTVTIVVYTAKRFRPLNSSDCVAKHGVNQPDAQEIADLRAKISELEIETANFGSKNNELLYRLANRDKHIKEVEDDNANQATIIHGMKLADLQAAKQIEELETFETAVMKRHNGYDKNNEQCPRPATPEQALQDLQDEWDRLEDGYAKRIVELETEVHRKETANQMIREVMFQREATIKELDAAIGKCTCGIPKRILRHADLKKAGFDMEDV